MRGSIHHRHKHGDFQTLDVRALTVGCYTVVWTLNTVTGDMPSALKTGPTSDSGGMASSGNLSVSEFSRNRNLHNQAPVLINAANGKRSSWRFANRGTAAQQLLNRWLNEFGRIYSIWLDRCLILRNLPSP